jgi:hypothetical protein
MCFINNQIAFIIGKLTISLLENMLLLKLEKVLTEHTGPSLLGYFIL